jgi:hypothetical protein
MKRAILVALATGTVITSALSIGAVTRTTPAAVGREEYLAALAGIEAARAELAARCDRAAAAQKETCRAEASAAETIRVADLEASYRHSEESARNAQRARVEARYLIERARCSALGGPRRDECQIKAHSVRGRALLDTAAPYQTRS